MAKRVFVSYVHLVYHFSAELCSKPVGLNRWTKQSQTFRFLFLIGPSCGVPGALWRIIWKSHKLLV